MLPSTSATAFTPESYHNKLKDFAFQRLTALTTHEASYFNDDAQNDVLILAPNYILTLQSRYMVVLQQQ